MGGKAEIPVGVQLYCVRNECQKDLPGTLTQIADMGYDGVEFADYFGRSAEELRAMLDANGLRCCGSHIYLETLLGDELDKTIAFNKTLGNKYLIVRWLDEKDYATREKWLEISELFNDIAVKLKPHGMRVGYHNHGYEFKAIQGEIPWDIFADHTSRDVILQLDTGNSSIAGADALHYMERNPGRAGTIHLKPYSATKPKALLGEDDIDWDRALAFCDKKGGVKWYIIEYEVEGIPPLEAIKLNLDHLRKMRS
ncbi:MAG: sugar phosphate isomerase/epimerase [Phycisphaerae bacterium]|nr:sugar phosphate isomerase/epimerase [Phycisphaerae bacterium]